MLLPTSMWSTQYLGAPLAGLVSNIYQVNADTDGTAVTFPGGNLQLAAGGSTQFSAPIGMITSNYPIQLIQLGQVRIVICV